MTKRFEYVDDDDEDYNEKLQRIWICSGRASADDDSDYEYDDDKDNIEIKSAKNLTVRSDYDDFYDEYVEMTMRRKMMEQKSCKEFASEVALGGPTCPATHKLPTLQIKNCSQYCTVANTAPSYTHTQHTVRCTTQIFKPTLK